MVSNIGNKNSSSINSTILAIECMIKLVCLEMSYKINWVDKACHNLTIEVKILTQNSMINV